MEIGFDHFLKFFRHVTVVAAVAGVSSPPTSATAGMPAPEFIDMVRKYFIGVKYLSNTLPPEVSTLIQDDMVKLRTEAGVSVRLM